MDFKFKKFGISHHEEVFKFGTDASLLATWKKISDFSTILEIGCGSGVITLMMAQRNPSSKYTGIDISKQAVNLSTFNLASFPIPSQIEFIESTLQAYSPSQKFDLIISNPPFFEDGTKSPSAFKNTTRHTDTLSLVDLLTHSKRLLNPFGEIHIIYPIRYLKALKEECAILGLYINQITQTRSTEKKPLKRILVSISLQKKELVETELIINGSQKGYSETVFNMLQPYLIKL